MWTRRWDLLLPSFCASLHHCYCTVLLLLLYVTFSPYSSFSNIKIKRFSVDSAYFGVVWFQMFNVFKIYWLDYKSPKTRQERAIMDERFEDIPTLHSTLNDHYTTLKMLFSSGTTWQGVGQWAQPGLHVQSCCHYLHVECYKTYSDSQRSRSTDPLHNPLKGAILG